MDSVYKKTFFVHEHTHMSHSIDRKPLFKDKEKNDLVVTNLSYMFHVKHIWEVCYMWNYRISTAMYRRHYVGMLGEKASALFLMKRGFTILSRNYRKKYGEIDIISDKNRIIHFIEVKTVSCEIDVSGIITKSSFRVEENVHTKKLHSIFTTIQVYLSEKKIPESREWQLDVHIVYLDVRNKRAKVDVIGNVTEWLSFMSNL